MALVTLDRLLEERRLRQLKNFSWTRRENENIEKSLRSRARDESFRLWKVQRQVLGHKAVIHACLAVGDVTIRAE